MKGKALPVELVGHRNLSGDGDQLFESSWGGLAVRLLACTVPLHLLVVHNYGTGEITSAMVAKYWYRNSAHER